MTKDEYKDEYKKTEKKVNKFECELLIKFKSSLRSTNIMKEKLKSISEKSKIDNVFFDFNIGDISNGFDKITFDEIFNFDVYCTCQLTRDDIEKKEEVQGFLSNYIKYHLRDFVQYYNVESFKFSDISQSIIFVEIMIDENEMEDNEIIVNVDKNVKLNEVANVTNKKIKEKINSNRRIFIIN